MRRLSELRRLCGNFVKWKPQRRPRFTTDASVWWWLCHFCLLVPLAASEQTSSSFSFRNKMFPDLTVMRRQVSFVLQGHYVPPAFLLCEVDLFPSRVLVTPPPLFLSSSFPPPPLVPFSATESHGPEQADKAQAMGETLVYRTPFHCVLLEINKTGDFPACLTHTTGSGLILPRNRSLLSFLMMFPARRGWRGCMVFWSRVPEVLFFS